MTTKNKKTGLSIMQQDWIIFFLFFVFIMGAVVIKPGLPIEIPSTVQKFYNTIEKMPDGSVILWWHLDGITSKFDIMPSDQVVYSHIFDVMRKRPNIKFVMAAGGPDAIPMIDGFLATLDTSGLKYGERYVWLGWIPGGENAVAGLAKDIRSIAPRDRYDTPIENLPMMSNINSASDVTYFIFSTGSDIDPIMRQWYGKTPNILAVLDVVVIPVSAAYIDKGMVQAYLSQLVPTAAYEKLSGKPGLGLAFVDANSASQIFFVGLAIVANIIFWSKGGRKPT